MQIVSNRAISTNWRWLSQSSLFNAISYFEKKISPSVSISRIWLRTSLYNVSTKLVQQLNAFLLWVLFFVFCFIFFTIFIVYWFPIDAVKKTQIGLSRSNYNMCIRRYSLRLPISTVYKQRYVAVCVYAFVGVAIYLYFIIIISASFLSRLNWFKE